MIESRTQGTGPAGTIDIAVTDAIDISRLGLINTSSNSAGRAGAITVRAGRLSIDAVAPDEFAGILSAASDRGDAGTVTVQIAGAARLVNGAQIGTSTFGAGRAGSVRLIASDVLIGSRSTVAAAARPGSFGQTGTVSVTARNSITLDGGKLSIQNDATVDNPLVLSPTLMSVAARDITLRNNGHITARSTGNIAASDIDVRFTNRLWLDPSAISADAIGHGGDIRVAGGKVVVLDHSGVTTSSLNGIAGDITLRADALVMINGFIAAHGDPQGGSDGNVTVDVHALVPSGGMLFVDQFPRLIDPEGFGFNVILAASPRGVTITAPVFDIAGGMKQISATPIAVGALSHNRCEVGQGSTFVQSGRGGLRPTASGMIRPELLAADGVRKQGGASERPTFLVAYDTQGRCR